MKYLAKLCIFRNMLAFVYIPVLQKELDTFRTSIWNNHRSRYQRDKELPVGVPEHIYNFPDKYGCDKHGQPITEEQLQEVAELSDVLQETDDYLTENFRHECERHVPDVDAIEPAEAVNAYLYLKANIDLTRVL